MANLTLSPKAGAPLSPSALFENALLSPTRQPNLSLPFKSMERSSATKKGGRRAVAQARAAAAACAESSTLYDILGVPKNVDSKDIKAAYRQLARLTHPDVAPADQKEESTKAFLQLHAAYNVLSDPENRAKYDLEMALAMPDFEGSKMAHSGQAYSYGYRHGGGYGGFDFVGRSNQGFSGYGADSFSGSAQNAHASLRPDFRGKSWETDQCWC